MINASGEAIAALDDALRVWAQAAADVSRRAHAATRELVANGELAVKQRARQVNTCEHAIAGARGEARAGLLRDLGATTEALERARRALRHAEDAERRAQTLDRRTREAAQTRVTRASRDLRHKLRALADYESAAIPSSDRVAAPGAYGPLVKMIGVALATEALDRVAEVGDQTTTRLPERLQDPASVGLALFHELHGNWDVYRLTPEMLSLHARELLDGR